MSLQNSANSTSTSSEDVVRATESLLACHLRLSTGSPLNVPYSFCDKDLPADRGLLYHTFILAAFSVLPSRDGWGREWHIIYVCDVNSKFNLCVVTKYRKWEIRVGNVIFLCFASSSLWYLPQKSTETRTDCIYIDLALPIDFHVSCQQPSMQTEK